MEKDKFIELPCNVGDKIYSSYASDRVIEYTVQYIEVYIDDKITEFSIHIKSDDGRKLNFMQADIGKEVFFTQKAAGIKLKEQKK